MNIPPPKLNSKKNKVNYYLQEANGKHTMDKLQICIHNIILASMMLFHINHLPRTLANYGITL